MTARFRIKIDHGYRQPIVVKDRTATAYIRRFGTLRAAMLHVDNRVRAERGMPPRLDIERADIIAAIRSAKAYNNPGEHSHAFGEPNAGCPVCYRDPVDFLIDQAIEQNIEAGLR